MKNLIIEFAKHVKDNWECGEDDDDLSYSLCWKFIAFLEVFVAFAITVGILSILASLLMHPKHLLVVACFIGTPALILSLIVRHRFEDDEQQKDS